MIPGCRPGDSSSILLGAAKKNQRIERGSYHARNGLKRDAGNAVLPDLYVVYNGTYKTL